MFSDWLITFYKSEHFLDSTPEPQTENVNPEQNKSALTNENNRKLVTFYKSDGFLIPLHFQHQITTIEGETSKEIILDTCLFLNFIIIFSFVVLRYKE